MLEDATTLKLMLYTLFPFQTSEALLPNANHSPNARVHTLFRQELFRNVSRITYKTILTKTGVRNAEKQ